MSQTAIAEALGISRRQVRRAVSETP